jgi:hypothetical protein
VDRQQVVTCVCVDAGNERWLLDPLLPPDDATQVWDRLAQRPALDWAGWTKQDAVVAYLKSVMKEADHSGD